MADASAVVAIRMLVMTTFQGLGLASCRYGTAHGSDYSIDSIRCAWFLGRCIALRPALDLGNEKSKGNMRCDRGGELEGTSLFLRELL